MPAMAPPAAITFENLRLERRTLLGIVDEQQVLDATFARSVRGITTTAIAELAEVVGPRLFAAQLGAPIYAEPTDDQLFGHAELANWRSLRASYALAQQHARAAGEAVKEARTRYGAHSPFGLFSRMVKDETFARKSQQLKRQAVAKELEFDEATEKVRGIKEPNDESAICYRRFHATTSVTGWSGLGACAFGTNVKEPCCIDTDDEPATCADTFYVDRWKAG